MSDKKQEAALQWAIQQIGGVNATARAFGITPSAVSQWKVCPPGHVIEMEKLSGVSRHDLRPDYYPEESHDE